MFLSSSCTALRDTMWPHWGRSPAKTVTERKFKSLIPFLTSFTTASPRPVKSAASWRIWSRRPQDSAPNTTRYCFRFRHQKCVLTNFCLTKHFICWFYTQYELFIYRFYPQNWICIRNCHFWPKNDGEKWCRKIYAGR